MFQSPLAVRVTKNGLSGRRGNMGRIVFYFWNFWPESGEECLHATTLFPTVSMSMKIQAGLIWPKACSLLTTSRWDTVRFAAQHSFRRATLVSSSDWIRVTHGIALFCKSMITLFVTENQMLLCEGMCSSQGQLADCPCTTDPNMSTSVVVRQKCRQPFTTWPSNGNISHNLRSFSLGNAHVSAFAES